MMNHSFQQNSAYSAQYQNIIVTTYTSNDTFPPHLTRLLFSIYRFTSFYFLALFIPLGIVFNLLIFLIFLKLPLGTPSTRVYYIVMAFGEFGTVLVKDLWFFWLGVGWPTVAWDTLGPLNPHSEHFNIWYCKLVIFMWFALEMPANLTFVVFAIERVIALYFPLKALFLFTQKRAMITISIVFVFSTSVSGICLKITDRSTLPNLMPHGKMCSFDTINIEDVLMGAVVLCFAFIIPAILSSICSVLISFKIISR